MKELGESQAISLLLRYSFDLGGTAAETLVIQWQRVYGVDWVRFAVVEALYQGRYKACSVEQILKLWQRRGQPLHHFNAEFERLVCGQVPADAEGSETQEGIDLGVPGNNTSEMPQSEGLEETWENLSLEKLTEVYPPSPIIPFSPNSSTAIVQTSGIKHTNFYAKLKAMMASDMGSKIVTDPD